MGWGAESRLVEKPGGVNRIRALFGHYEREMPTGYLSE